MRRDFTSSRILVVDDLAGTRRIVRAALESAGFQEVVEASNGIEALNKIREGEGFDLVICDYNMGPDLPNGLDVFAEMQKSPEAAKTAFILLTAQIDLQLMKEATTSGVFAYVPKPVREDVLLSKATSALRALQISRLKNKAAPPEQLPGGDS